MAHTQSHSNHYTLEAVGSDVGKDEIQARHPVTAGYLPLEGSGGSYTPPFPEIDGRGDISVWVVSTTSNPTLGRSQRHFDTLKPRANEYKKELHEFTKLERMDTLTESYIV
ncbi:hypothetical protein V493_07202 [Pseudogymnoascus sp. VKM F-4281 (FW-2241)]|nr:hypothetical protein V493_07202 [Pseudogymnoascus sp. VKM F-4281 (FW-2241)]